MEVEGQSMAEQLGSSADREKGLTQNFVLLLYLVVTCLYVCTSLEMELGLSQEAVSQRLEAKEKAEERARKAIKGLCREYFFMQF